MPILPTPHNVQASRISGTYVFVMVFPDGSTSSGREHAVLVP